jgi:hypothetical protein
VKFVSLRSTAAPVTFAIAAIVAVVAVAAVVVTVVIAAKFLLGLGEPDRGSWVHANNQIIDGIAGYPGASELLPRKTEVQSDGLLTGGVQGYTTIASFRVLGGLTEPEFRRFFRSRLPRGWKCTGSGGTPPDAVEFDCRRGGALVAMLWGLPQDRPGYTITADKGYAQDKDASN